MTRVAYYQEWAESERGWGCRPDGYRLYSNVERAKVGTQKTMEDQHKFFLSLGMKEGSVPEEYSRPSGGVNPIEVTDEVFQYLEGHSLGLYVNNIRDIKLPKVVEPPVEAKPPMPPKAVENPVCPGVAPWTNPWTAQPSKPEDVKILLATVTKPRRILKKIR